MPLSLDTISATNFMSMVLGGAKFIAHVSMILVVKLTSVVVLVLLYDCIGILTLVVCVCVHDAFGNHVDLGGLSVCA